MKRPGLIASAGAFYYGLFRVLANFCHAGNQKRADDQVHVEHAWDCRDRDLI